MERCRPTSAKARATIQVALFAVVTRLVPAIVWIAIGCASLDNDCLGDPVLVTVAQWLIVQGVCDLVAFFSIVGLFVADLLESCAWVCGCGGFVGAVLFQFVWAWIGIGPAIIAAECREGSATGVAWTGFTAVAISFADLVLTALVLLCGV